MTASEQLVGAIVAAFAEPPHAVPYALTRRLGVLFGDRFVLATEESEFDVEGYVAAGLCAQQPWVDMVAQQSHHWDERPLCSPEIGAWSMRWTPAGGGERMFDHVRVQWPSGFCDKVVHYVAAPSQREAEEFFDAVCRWNRVLEEVVLVFDRGRWHKSHELFHDIQQTRMEDLILPGQDREEIAGDLQRFIDRREEYARFGVPWKRGILFAGPPGNGKTMCIKALANSLRVGGTGDESSPIDCLYVRSLAMEHVPDHYTIGNVFRRARASVPCLLVFEDLDSLVTQQNRSVFLNELDGLAANDGLIVIASTNHPERLDSALRDRPSRFDRTWQFELPGESERRRYLEDWDGRMQSVARLDADGCVRVAGATDGFSFAYLKELMVSALMRWIDGRDRDSSLALPAVVDRQVGLLREQMARARSAPVSPPPGDLVAEDDGELFEYGS